MLGSEPPAPGTFRKPLIPSPKAADPPFNKVRLVFIASSPIVSSPMQRRTPCGHVRSVEMPLNLIRFWRVRIRLCWGVLTGEVGRSHFQDHALSLEGSDANWDDQDRPGQAVFPLPGSPHLDENKYNKPCDGPELAPGVNRAENIASVRVLLKGPNRRGAASVQHRNIRHN